MVNRFEKLLRGGDLRSIGKNEHLIPLVQSQKDFDVLFSCLRHKDRVIVMRAADCIEKISASNFELLASHEIELLSLCNKSSHKELKWHLAQLIGRLPTTTKNQKEIRRILTNWATDKNESRIVRVNALQSLYGLTLQNRNRTSDLLRTFADIEKERIPSLSARIKKLKKELFSLNRKNG